MQQGLPGPGQLPAWPLPAAPRWEVWRRSWRPQQPERSPQEPPAQRSWPGQPVEPASEPARPPWRGPVPQRAAAPVVPWRQERARRQAAHCRAGSRARRASEPGRRAPRPCWRRWPARRYRGSCRGRGTGCWRSSTPSPSRTPGSSSPRRAPAVQRSAPAGRRRNTVAHRLERGDQIVCGACGDVPAERSAQSFRAGGTAQAAIVAGADPGPPAGQRPTGLQPLAHEGEPHELADRTGAAATDAGAAPPGAPRRYDALP